MLTFIEVSHRILMTCNLSSSEFMNLFLIWNYVDIIICLNVSVIFYQNCKKESYIHLNI